MNAPVNASSRKAALNILGSLKRAYGAMPTRVPVREGDFPGLDLAPYRRFDAAMREAGFTPLCDYAVREINESPTTLLAPTFIRNYASADSSIIAATYQKRPRWDRLRAKLFTGLKNGRWIAAPRMVFKNARTQQCAEFSSAVAGSFITTSNAEAAESIGMPATLDRKFHPYSTPAEVLLADHRARLAQAISRHGGQAPATVSSTGELMTHLDRESQIKREHRVAIGWITHAELLRMSNNNTAQADAIYAEIRTLLREEAQQAAAA